MGARDERPALRWLTELKGASFEIVYLPLDRTTQIGRIERRGREAAHETFAMTVSDVDRWRDQFEVPDDEELAGARPHPPPGDWVSWLAWAEDRWPSVSTG